MAKIVSVFVTDGGSFRPGSSIDDTGRRYTDFCLPVEGDYNAMERSAKSLIGRLLNPECQNMSRMLRSIPQIWEIYERVRGIALTRESFQFIFELETYKQL